MLNKASSLTYIKSFDSLRAFAVILVILSHWYSGNIVLSKLPLGIIGVNIFFVLSGFLITGILVYYKEKIDLKLDTPGYYIKKFYYRRTLRIFPIYYLLLIVLLTFKRDIFAGSAIWHITYLSDYYFVFIRKAWHGSLSHLWSLSVEEQFYLFWPFIILYSSSRLLKLWPVILICIGIASRYFNPPNLELWNYFIPSCLDSFGIGALIAINKSKLTHNLKLYLSLLFLSIALGVINYLGDFNQVPLVVNVIAALLIMICYNGFSSKISWLTENRLIIYLGKISYGLYLYHNFIPKLYFLQFPKPVNLILPWFLLIILAAVSYEFMEKPFLKLKDKLQ